MTIIDINNREIIMIHGLRFVMYLISEKTAFYKRDMNLLSINGDRAKMDSIIPLADIFIPPKSGKVLNING